MYFVHRDGHKSTAVVDGLTNISRNINFITMEETPEHPKPEKPEEAIRVIRRNLITGYTCNISNFTIIKFDQMYVNLTCVCAWLHRM